MKKEISLLMSILFSIVSFSQKKENQLFIGNFYADKSTINEIYIDLPSILSSKNQIEIRLRIRETWQMPWYIVLSFDKDWTITEYIYNGSDKPYILKSQRTDKSLENVFQNLVQNNVFSLPNSMKGNYSNFNLKTNKVEKIANFITDGNSYNLEFKVGDNYRAYSFLNPEIHARFHSSDHVMEDFNAIVTILTSEIKP